MSHAGGVLGEQEAYFGSVRPHVRVRLFAYVCVYSYVCTYVIYYSVKGLYICNFVCVHEFVSMCAYTNMCLYTCGRLVSVRQELANLADTHADRLRARWSNSPLVVSIICVWNTALTLLYNRDRFIEWFREGQREVLSSVLVALDAMLEETHTDNGNGVTA